MEEKRKIFCVWIGGLNREVSMGYTAALSRQCETM